MLKATDQTTNYSQNFLIKKNDQLMRRMDDLSSNDTLRMRTDEGGHMPLLFKVKKLDVLRQKIHLQSDN